MNWPGDTHTGAGKQRHKRRRGGRRRRGEKKKGGGGGQDGQKPDSYCGLMTGDTGRCSYNGSRASVPWNLYTESRTSFLESLKVNHLLF